MEVKIKRRTIILSIVCLIFSISLETGQDIKTNENTLNMHPYIDFKTTMKNQLVTNSSNSSLDI